MDRNVNIITDLDGKQFVLINDIRFKGKNREEWKEIEEYLKQYVGEFYEISETAEKIYISSDFPDEYANSENRIKLKGKLSKAKANASQGIPELIQIATNEQFSENTKVERYNVYFANMLVRHDEDGKKYLYDLLGIKKETSSPLES